MNSMAYLHVLLICFASCSFAFFLSSRNQQWQRSSRNFLHVLKGTRATPTEDAITPAEYEKDLYRVLGVSSNSTKEQLRDAYWAIASRNHPDRNSSIEALWLFRNASRAYQILGKDKKTRDIYDQRFSTDMYIQAFEELSSTVMKPLAMDVALPLLNLTARTLSGMAMPFFRDIAEQFQVVQDATGRFEEDVGDDVGDFVKRAGNAITKKSNEQKIRRIQNEIAYINKTAALTSEQLKDSDKSDGEIIAKLESLESMLKAATASLQTAKSQEEKLKSIYSESKLQVQRFDEALEGKSAVLKDLELQMFKVQLALTDEMKEITRLSSWSPNKQRSDNNEISILEEALQAAKDNAAKLEGAKSQLLEAMSYELSVEETLRKDNAKVTAAFQDAQENFRKAEQEKNMKYKSVRDLEREIATSKSAIGRQNEYRDILVKKLGRLSAKNETLQFDLKKALKYEALMIQKLGLTNP